MCINYRFKVTLCKKTIPSEIMWRFVFFLSSFFIVWNFASVKQISVNEFSRIGRFFCCWKIQHVDCDEVDIKKISAIYFTLAIFNEIQRQFHMQPVFSHFPILYKIKKIIIIFCVVLQLTYRTRSVSMNRESLWQMDSNQFLIL